MKRESEIVIDSKKGTGNKNKERNVQRQKTEGRGKITTGKGKN